MDTPKISVLIPLYNRKHYIDQCIDSVLGQTFKDYEIIVRDDGSRDGSADYVAQRFAPAIAAGKIKLRRNEKNIGEFPTDNRLLREATGKYIMILHSDDLYLPHALEHMYTVAEKFQADVVHESVHLTTSAEIITQGTPLNLKFYDAHRVKKVMLMPNEPVARFNEWLGGIGRDAPHNIFRKKFLIDNDLFFESFEGGITGGNSLLALKWLMRAKIFVKTPQPFYVYRDATDSITRAKFPPERIAKFISAQIKLSRLLDEFFATEEFFKGRTDLQYLVRSKFFSIYDNYWLNRDDVYGKGMTPELYFAVEGAFKKYFGDDANYPTFLFHWAHELLSNQKRIKPHRNV